MQMPKSLFSQFSSSSSATQASDAVQLGKNALGISSNESMCPSMAFETRMQGFVSCFILGWILSIISVIAISLGNITGFCILYSAGNVVCILSTGFLMGPYRQCQNMFAQGRIVATLVFLSSIVITIVVAVQTKNIVAVIILVIIQFFAGLWYTLSYIPGARMLITNCCRASAGV